MMMMYEYNLVGECLARGSTLFVVEACEVCS